MVYLSEVDYPDFTDYAHVNHLHMSIIEADNLSVAGFHLQQLLLIYMFENQIILHYVLVTSGLRFCLLYYQID